MKHTLYGNELVNYFIKYDNLPSDNCDNINHRNDADSREHLIASMCEENLLSNTTSEARDFGKKYLTDGLRELIKEVTKEI